MVYSVTDIYDNSSLTNSGVPLSLGIKVQLGCMTALLSLSLRPRGRAALQGMVFRPYAHKHGLKFKDFRRFFINRV